MHTYAPTVRLFARVLALFIIVPVAASAADQTDAPRGYWRFQEENDMLLGQQNRTGNASDPTASDRNYTQGLRFDGVYAHGTEPAWFREVLSDLNVELKGDLMGWYFGQLIFTPGELTLEDPPLTDRPYGGWLFFGLQRMTLKENWREMVALSVGATGRWSLAEQAQRGLHRAVRKAIDPEKGWVSILGWDTQLPAEPTLDIFLEHRELVALPTVGRFQAQFIPYVNANVGTVMVAARLGVTARAGFNLPNDFGYGPIPQAIPLALPFKALFTRAKPVEQAVYVPPVTGKPAVPWLGFHAFATFEGKFVGRNLFLDGTFFRSSRSIEKELTLRDFIWGAELKLGGCRITYSRVRRGREFVSQPYEQYFHSAAVTIDY